jgi:RHS repeat-associated protein
MVAAACTLNASFDETSKMSEPISVRFTGAYADAITAGYPLGNGYRWYLPGLMRFNAPDEDSPFRTPIVRTIRSIIAIRLDMSVGVR